MKLFIIGLMMISTAAHAKTTLCGIDVTTAQEKRNVGEGKNPLSFNFAKAVVAADYQHVRSHEV